MPAKKKAIAKKKATVKKKRRVSRKRKKARGRPSKWDDSFLELAYKGAKLGATDAGLAELLGVSIGTIENWQRDKPEFKDQVALGKKIANNGARKALLRRAIGFSYTDTTTTENFEYKTEQGEIVKVLVSSKTVTSKKHVAPDHVAAFMWLKNRERDSWRNTWDSPKGDADEDAIPVEAIEFVTVDARVRPPVKEP